MREYSSIQAAIMSAIAHEGGVSSVERLGFSSAQIAISLRGMLNDGLLVLKDSSFSLAPGVVPPIGKRPWQDLGILYQYAVEKVGENDEYVIRHRSFALIRERVRP
jgi:hypothetical protein